jgi:hypothetical protein
MSLKIKCYGCNKELSQPGALLFSPPEEQFPDENKGIGYELVTKKYHICVECYPKIIGFIITDGFHFSNFRQYETNTK